MKWLLQRCALWILGATTVEIGPNDTLVIHDSWRRVTDAQANWMREAVGARNAIVLPGQVTLSVVKRREAR